MRSASVFLARAVLGLGSATLSFAADDLPTKAPGEAPDFVPSLELIEVPPARDEGATEAPRRTQSVDAAKAALDRARSKQQRWQLLAKRGVLSQAEAESSALGCAKALVDYQNARVAEERAQLEKVRQQTAAAEALQPAVEAAEAALATAAAAAAEAEEALKKTKLMLADVNVRRQRLLRAAGIGSRTQLQRAEAALQKLQEPVTNAEPATK